ncbi:hypothetical protein N7532_004236 [Penicillium argentinense]|uniref:Uncharacterized protein n=1 Tax=Penicillium argentinense TaxID=1131581 RepID=A0A9W9FNZ2_9EURO|nr:uncharacterized protein N7532_004236 [Penicillium argentinense]KAJ5103707.1 hypothetical protein N7532_004236 [Penicillium argentinense]
MKEMLVGEERNARVRRAWRKRTCDWAQDSKAVERIGKNALYFGYKPDGNGVFMFWDSDRA